MIHRLLKLMCILSLILTFEVAFANPQEIVQLADYLSVDYPNAIKDGVVINDAE